MFLRHYPPHSKHVRVLCYRPNHGLRDPYPQIPLKGHWLGQLDFTTGQKLEVITQPGQLIIRLADEE
ncbi:SymE family type I addiction module toxin [Rahnella victoriana]|uniref:SymE family type I addiction module toxin n=1 Tax=Rahnella victoriana TaxID=1510570 RepID=UPI000BB1EE34|nr:SymE family type I addiction module toxin [Rahnella victoriana]